MIDCYEIPNTFTPEMPLDEQIAQGCNDWRADLPNGVSFLGRTQEEALRLGKPLQHSGLRLRSAMPKT
jgi:hypothetical protein